MSLAALRSRLADGPPCFSPFFMLGDPDPDTSLQVCRAALEGGADMLELGIPYSDPCADGPSVQAACVRALSAGTDVDTAMGLLRVLRSESEVPFNLLVYGNLVHRRGWREFARLAAASGASSILVPDVPVEEGGELAAACEEAELGAVQLAGPGSDRARLQRLGEACTGFLYLAGRQGITGARDDRLSEDVRQSIRIAAEVQTAPVCVGFGLKTRAHVEAVHECGARVAIVGSALLDRLSAQLDEFGRPRGLSDMLQDMKTRVEELAGRR